MPATFEKTVCPISRERFAEVARALKVRVGDEAILALPKNFSTWSLGFYANQKVTLNIGGEPVVVQLQIQATLVGSKDLPRE